MAKKMGRPKTEINKEQFESLCNLQCTKEEIAGFFKCSLETIENFCRREYNDTFSGTFKTYSQNGKISLRRLQFRLAEKSYSMAIWLGKQYLGQTEKIEQTNSYEDLNSLADMLKMDEVAKLKKRIKELEELLKEKQE